MPRRVLAVAGDVVGVLPFPWRYRLNRRWLCPRPGVPVRGWRHTIPRGQTWRGPPTGYRWRSPPCHRPPVLRLRRHLHRVRRRRHQLHRQWGRLMQPGPHHRLDLLRPQLRRRRLLGPLRPLRRVGPHHLFASSPGTPARSSIRPWLLRFHRLRPLLRLSTSPTRQAVRPSGVPGSRCHTARLRARRRVLARTAASRRSRTGTPAHAGGVVVALPPRRDAPLPPLEAVTGGGRGSCRLPARSMRLSWGGGLAPSSICAGAHHQV